MADVSDCHLDTGNLRGESVATEPPNTPTHAAVSLAVTFGTPMTDQSSSTVSTLSHSESGPSHINQQCNMKICDEVDEVTAEVPYEKFMRLAFGKPTGCLTPEQVSQIGDFSGLARESLKREWQMYPIFVSKSDISTQLFSDKVNEV